MTQENEKQKEAQIKEQQRIEEMRKAQLTSIWF